MVARVLDRLAELLDNVWGSRQVWVAHPEVDDVVALGTGLDLQFIHDAEDIGRQPLDPTKLLHPRSFPSASRLLTPEDKVRHHATKWLPHCQ